MEYRQTFKNHIFSMCSRWSNADDRKMHDLRIEFLVNCHSWDENSRTWCTWVWLSDCQIQKIGQNGYSWVEKGVEIHLEINKSQQQFIQNSTLIYSDRMRLAKWFNHKTSCRTTVGPNQNLVHFQSDQIRHRMACEKEIIIIFNLRWTMTGLYKTLWKRRHFFQ